MSERETEADSDGGAEGGRGIDGESETDGDLPDRVRRAFADHGSFEPAGDGVWTAETTPFDAEVRAEPAADGRVRFAVTVRVPTLSATAADEVADVVEEGWIETFELRVVDVGGVTRGDREFDPTVEVGDDEIEIGFELTDINERRGVDDSGALIDFVEGTYVQGVIPGYEYAEPLDALLSAARQQGNSGGF
ncbi:DUF5813 family protein [Halorubrum salsamenti]|jgi:hypothetical protein|uniref:DUF5813 family protein n=1 Tax=Halorubrum salsamenti TaxID=2583990 RepID=UPI0011A40E88|nr:DUF5813 family protein [Halorubrum salsamenti]